MKQTKSNGLGTDSIVFVDDKTGEAVDTFGVRKPNDEVKRQQETTAQPKPPQQQPKPQASQQKPPATPQRHPEQHKAQTPPSTQQKPSETPKKAADAKQQQPVPEDALTRAELDYWSFWIKGLPLAACSVTAAAIAMGVLLYAFSPIAVNQALRGEGGPVWMIASIFSLAMLVASFGMMLATFVKAVVELVKKKSFKIGRIRRVCSAFLLTSIIAFVDCYAAGIFVFSVNSYIPLQFDMSLFTNIIPNITDPITNCSVANGLAGVAAIAVIIGVIATIASTVVLHLKGEGEEE